MQDVDGLILVHDPRKASTAAALETLYKKFTERHPLTKKQCLVLGCNMAGRRDSHSGPSVSSEGASRLQLPQASVSIDPTCISAAERTLRASVDTLIQHCLDTQAQRVEDEVAGDMGTSQSVQSLA
jgi:hypothetical protein